MLVFIQIKCLQVKIGLESTFRSYWKINIVLYITALYLLIYYQSTPYLKIIFKILGPVLCY